MDSAAGAAKRKSKMNFYAIVNFTNKKTGATENVAVAKMKGGGFANEVAARRAAKWYGTGFCVVNSMTVAQFESDVAAKNYAAQQSN